MCINQIFLFRSHNDFPFRTYKESSLRQPYQGATLFSQHEVLNWIHPLFAPNRRPYNIRSNNRIYLANLNLWQKCLYRNVGHHLSSVLHTLRQFSFEGKAGFIYAGTYDVDALLEDPKYGITGQLVGCKKEQISEIDSESATELIQVLHDKLIFTEEATNHIHKLSGDVPYFVQMICKYCGFYAVENKRAIIGYPELEHVIKILTGEMEANESSLVKALPENVFQNNMFSPADPKEVNVLISSIVYFNRDNVERPRGVSMMELQELWATKNISQFRPKLADSIELLRKKRVLIDDKDEELPVYSLTVDLFRRWWSVHHPDIDLEIDTIM